MSDHKFYEAMQERAKSQLQRYVNGSLAVSSEDALMMLLIGELRDLNTTLYELEEDTGLMVGLLEAIKKEYCGE